MKKHALLATAVCLSMTCLAGCGSETNNTNTEVTASPETNQSTVSPDATDNSALDDVENGVNDVIDGAGDAVDDTVDGIEDAADDVTGNEKDNTDNETAKNDTNNSATNGNKTKNR